MRLRGRMVYTAQRAVYTITIPLPVQLWLQGTGNALLLGTRQDDAGQGALRAKCVQGELAGGSARKRVTRLGGHTHARSPAAPGASAGSSGCALQEY